MIVVDICRFVLRAIIRLAMLAVALVVVAALLVGARLLIGPVSLASFVPEVERRAALALGPDRLSIGHADLVIDARARRLRLSVQDLVVRDPDGATVAEFAQMSARIDPLALLRGEVSVYSAEIEGADAVLLRTAEGRFRFGLTTPSAPAAGQAVSADSAPDEGEAFEAVRLAVEAMTGDAGAPAPFTQFEGLTVRDLNVTYRDELGGVTWRAPNTTVDFRNEGDGAWARAATAIEVDGSGRPVVIDISGRRRAGDPWLALDARIQDAPTEALARQTPELDALTTIDGRVSGALRLRVNLDDGELGAVSAALTAQDARIRLAENDTAPLQSGEAIFSFDPTADRLSLERISYVSEGPRGRLIGEASGELSFVRNSDGQTIGAEGEVALAATSIGGPALFEPPLKLDRGGARLAIATGPDGVDITVDRLQLQGPVVDLAGGAQLHLSPDGDPRIEADLTQGRFDATLLDDIWPIGPAPGGRAWVAQNLMGGAIDDIVISLRLGEAPATPGESSDGSAPVGLDESVRISFVVEDLAGSYINGLPPITGAQGRGLLTRNQFTLDLDAAQTRSPAGGAVRLGGSRFVVPDFEPDPPSAEIRLRAEGDLTDVTQLLNLAPLSLIDKFGAAADDFRGGASAQASLAFPLAKDLALEDIDVTVQAALAQLEIARDAIGADLAADAAALYVDQTGLSLRAGAAEVDGRRAAVAMREVFAPGAREARRVVELSSVVRPAEMSGLGAATDRIEGAAQVELRVESRDGAADRIRGEVDLTDVSVALPEFAWRKRRGESSVLAFDAVRDAAGLTINSFEVDAVDARAEGEIRFDGDGALQRIDLSRLVVGEQVDLAVALNRDGAVWRLDLDGDLLDLTTVAPAMSDAAEAEIRQSNAPAPSSPPPIAIDVDVAKLRLHDGVVLTEARVVGARGADGGASLDIAAVAGAAPVSASLRVNDGQVSAELKTPDAGALLRAFDILEATRGGDLRLDARGPLDGPFEGDLLIENIVFERVPPLLDAISVGLIFGALDKATSGGLTFTRISTPFTIDDTALTLVDGVAVGPSLGATVNGAIGRDTGALDLRGSLSPAYAINGLVGQVPILGRIITGGRGEGVLGVAFRVRGTTQDPDVSVNPLSALTPGFLRKIFSARPRERSATEPPSDPSGGALRSNRESWLDQ